MRVATFLGTLLASQVTVSALSPAGWREQSIYQVVTDRFALTSGGSSPSCTSDFQLSIFCNGTFRGIIDKLDYIQGMGFTAMWISPIVENIKGGTPDGYTEDGSAYHGYWAQDIYAINPHFGTPEDLVALAEALHNRGMYLMVDIVVNHMGYYCGKAEDGHCGPQGTIDYSIYNPFNSEKYFHPFCEINYNNATSILVCWEGDEIVPLPDLRTENTTVQSMFDTWITELVKNYTIDGLRIDSLQQSGSFFFPSFYKAAGELYMVGEVFQEYPAKVCPYQQDGMPGVLNYPMFYYITDAFQDSTGSMSGLAEGISYMQGNCSDTTLLGSFLENQDNPRFPSYTEDITRAKNAIAFTMLQDGIPIIYYGQEQHLNGSGVPQNREALWSSGGYNTASMLYNMIKEVNAIRTQAIHVSQSFVTEKITTPYYDNHTIVTRKGETGSQIIGVYSNLGENGAYYNLSLKSAVTGFGNEEKIMEILTCTLLTTSSDGEIIVPMGEGQPKILFPFARLSGSSICKSYKTISPVGIDCEPATITFDILVNTTYGESVVVAGDIPELGDWNVPDGLYLNASKYTTENPLWTGTATGIDPQEVFQWKPVVILTNGSYVYAPGDNIETVAPGPGCNPTATIKYVFSGQ
ncbi:carbohydrate-binding module family 20 protein [Acidomyces richmondensis BFW]|nr:MAG: carbohydrate-binding module family 20 protein [Acidomyces sp. 'richmondensis']KYG47229.1 carbohydrate-binding module family 20 protein [Acidomyces richmondensis BFW]